MTDEKYNGWTNRPTWNTALWLFNNQSRHAMMRDIFSNKEATPKTAETFCRGTFGKKTPDGHSLDVVDWKEIAAAINEQ